MQNSLQTINYQCPKPKNFDESDPEFDIFKNVAPDFCFAAKTKIFKNARISTNSVIFNYFKIFPENCISQKNYENYSKGFRFFLKFIFPKFNFSKKRFLVITDEWTSNYYHWHVFALKKLLALKEENLLENALLFLPKKYQKYKFVLPSLEKFGIKKNQIVFLRRKSNIKAREVITATVPQQHPLAFGEIRKILTQDITKSDSISENKIYISRDGQVLRNVENEKEVVELLTKFGFKKVIAEKLSYEEQVKIFSQAKYLVGPHGAGLTNILFMAKDSKFLEIAATPCAEKPVTDYYKLASMLGVQYFYQECKIGETSKVMDFHHGNLVVDVQKLEKNLQLMLQNE